MKLKAFTMIAAMVAVGATARADRTTASGQNMNDGDSGSYWDISNSFFGFGSDLTETFWGAEFTIPTATGTSSLITIDSVNIFWYSAATDPLDGDTGGVGGTLASDSNSTACSLVGVQPNASGVPTTIGSPEFVAGETTTVTCQFANPSFFPASSNASAFYVVLGLTDLTVDPTVNPASGGSNSLTFLSTDPRGTASTPEPSAFALLGTVVGGALALKRRLA